MQGDFSRFTFDPRKHYRSVHMQQGRVQLDADWNEQIAILNYYFETQLRDILGASGAPQASAGFKVSIVEETDDRTQKLQEIPQLHHDQHVQQAQHPHHGQHGQDAQHSSQTQHAQQTQSKLDFSLSPGRYYVNGILCENEQAVLFSVQPYFPHASVPSTLKEHCLVYLDVWQRHITAFEDDSLREIALGGIDTTTRTQTVWQVKLLPLNHHDSHELLAQGNQVTYEDVVHLPEWHEMVHRHTKKAMLSAHHNPNSSVLDNQLYRVEIHQVHDGKATFKWSRENGSIVFEVEKIAYEKNDDGTADCTVIVSDLGRDMSQLRKGDWVEFSNETTVLHGNTLPLYQVTYLSDAASRQVTLTGPHNQAMEALAQKPPNHLLLRRWDYNHANPVSQKSGTYPVQEDVDLELERGIQVRFSAGGTYSVGDYWLIPSRTLLNDIDWPRDEHGPLAQPPRGNQHHYCPLALLRLHKHSWTVTRDLRRIFAPLPTLSERTAHLKRSGMVQPGVTETEIIEEVIERNVLYEECTSQDELVPGDLVSLIPGTGTGTNLQVTKANKENAKLVFGVVSATYETGRVTREAREPEEAGESRKTEETGETKETRERRCRVTTYGRARCKVIGSVEAGDLLTVSEESGCATKTGSIREFFHAGSLVGKALASYTPTAAPSEDILPPDDDDNHITPGMIDILITLQ